VKPATRRVPQLFALAAVLAFGGVGAALVSQHVFDMQPCAWCVLQRLIFIVIGLVALVGLAGRARALRLAASLVVLVLAAAGVASALWQHFVAASSTSCRLTLADRIVGSLGLDGLAPDVFAARASCAEASVAMLGVSYAFWSLALFVLLGAIASAAALGAARH
jgi:disulfide bond formation protein DsbB